MLDQVREYAGSSQAPAAARVRLAGLAFSYLELDKYAKAADVAEQLVRQFPDRALAPVYWILGSAYLQLNADLVMLIACRSGAGKVSADGMFGFTRAFL